MLAREKGAGLDADDLRRNDAGDRSQKAVLPRLTGTKGSVDTDVAAEPGLKDPSERVDGG